MIGVVTAFACSLIVGGSFAGKTEPPAPYGVIPSKRALAHADMDAYAFLHFSPNTFTDREWGQGDEDPNVFNPDHFDPDQIVLALKAGGMKGAILTCKHHDGFCLWPTKTTDHSIAASKWEGGHGDVVKAISEACKRHGLKFGVYLSPWDRNNAHYGTPAYVSIYREQLKELLTGYGPIFEVWHDGANGGDGYYGGARETRSIDRSTYYGWPTTWAEVRRLQPEACIFTDVGPDLRWVGNEEGVAGETCWATFTPVGMDGKPSAPGLIDTATSPTGTLNGEHWIPAECDVSIRPGWFWHQSENDKVKSAAQLVDLYYKSVGRGAFFLLNVPPNRHGVVESADVASLKRYHEIIQETFAHNLLGGARIETSNVRGGEAKYDGGNLLSETRNHFWATDDDVTTPHADFHLSGPKTFNVIRLKEAIQLGQRVDSFAVDAWESGSWQQVGAATSVGRCRLIRLNHPVTTDRVRLRITACPVCPVLYGFGIFREPQS
jgi:alpha-L-fucosidase